MTRPRRRQAGPRLPDIPGGLPKQIRESLDHMKRSFDNVRVITHCPTCNAQVACFGDGQEQGAKRVTPAFTAIPNGDITAMNPFQPDYGRWYRRSAELRGADQPPTLRDGRLWLVSENETFDLECHGRRGHSSDPVCTADLIVHRDEILDAVSTARSLMKKQHILAQPRAST